MIKIESFTPHAKGTRETKMKKEQKRVLKKHKIHLAIWQEDKFQGLPTA